jgi:type I restriction enzyme, S subunit
MSSMYSEVALGELIKLKNDKSKQLKSNEYLKSGCLPIVDQSKDLVCGYTNDLEKKFDKGLPVTIFGDHTLHVKFVDFYFAIGADGTQVISCKDSEGNEKYLYYLINYASSLITSHGYSRHFKILKEFCVPFSSDISEQQKIASILTSVDTVIEKTEAQINKLKDLKKAMMQELLTKGIGHTEFKDSPVGRIPVEWEVVKFADFATLQRGFDLPVQDRLGGQIPIFGSNGVVGFHNESKVSANGVLTGRSGSLGDVFFVKKPFWALNTSLYVKDFHGNNTRFVYYFMKWFDLAKYGTGTGVPTLNRNDVHIVDIAVPPRPEQNDIEQIFSALDKDIDSKQILLSRKMNLKKALMQDLLTGTVRVKV